MKQVRKARTIQTTQTRPISAELTFEQTEQLGRFLDWCDKATEEQWENGRNWYGQAFDFCSKLSYRFDLPVNAVIELVAALSPRVRWQQQVLSTGGFINTVLSGRDPRTVAAGGAFKANRVKAGLILDAAVAGRSYAGILKGPKVTAFAASIRAAGLGINTDRACVDSWIIEALTGRRAERRDFFPEIQAAYQTVVEVAAGLLGELVQDCQAGVWLAISQNGEALAGDGEPAKDD